MRGERKEAPPYPVEIIDPRCTNPLVLVENHAADVTSWKRKTNVTAEEGANSALALV